MSERSWTALELVKITAEYLAQKGVPEARLDAEVLLGEVLGCSRMKLYTQHDRPLKSDEVGKYREMVRRRAGREPVSRILGRREFMGLPVKVTPDVLSPRPDTEILVEQALKVLRPDLKNIPLPAFDEAGHVKTATAAVGAPQTKALDLCTGSGCVALALAAFCPEALVVATDISAEALLVAKENAEKLGLWLRLDLREGDLFKTCWDGETFDLIVSNPPYLVEGDDEIWPEVSDYDPALALYGGSDGLEFYRKILAEAELFLEPGGWVMLEVGHDQAGAVAGMMREFTLLEQIATEPDHAGIARVVKARKPLR